MNIDAFEIVLSTTVFVGFYVIYSQLGEVRTELRKIRQALGGGEGDEEVLAEVSKLVANGKSRPAIVLYRSHFGASLAEAAAAIAKLESGMPKA